MPDTSDSPYFNRSTHDLGKKISKEEIIADLHLETAKISWVELQRFFAAGKLLLLDENEDMLDVASSLISNDVVRLNSLIEQKLIVHPSDKQAKQWFDGDAFLWAVVLNPWVLVQENSS